MNFFIANRKSPDGAPRSAVSHLGLFWLPLSHTQEARLKCVNFTMLYVLLSVVDIGRVSDVCE